MTAGLKKLCFHNFVKFVIDKQYSFEDILAFSERIKSFEPYSFELDYLIAFSANDEWKTQMLEEEASANVKTNKDYVLDYIDKMFESYKKVDEDLDLDYLKKLASSYYENSQTNGEEEEA